jgi:hypothetical protein
MFKPDGGYNNFNETQVEEAVKDGWKVITEEEWNAILAAKRKPVENMSETATIDAQPARRVGRPRKYE